MPFDKVGFKQVSDMDCECILLQLFVGHINRFSIQLCSIDIKEAQKEAAKAPHCPLEVRASESDNDMGAEYFAKNKDQIRQHLT